MVVALKNSMRTPPIYLPCVSKEKCLLFLFHSLTLSLCFSLFFGLHLQLKLSLFCCVLLSLELTYNGQERLSVFSFFLTRPNGLCFPSFLLLSVSACLTRLSHCPGKNGMLTLEHFSLREVRPLHVLVTSQ